MPIAIGRGTLRVPLADSTTPCVLVGPGTGVAALRALCHWRQKATTTSDAQLLLFYGGRNATADFYFADEYATMPVVRVVTAFSRDQPHKIYVQQRIAEHADDVWRMLSDGELSGA